MDPVAVACTGSGDLHSADRACRAGQTVFGQLTAASRLLLLEATSGDRGWLAVVMQPAVVEFLVKIISTL